MKRAEDVSQGSQVGEMAIVDTFTRLIFGESSGFSAEEDAIIRALRSVDDNVAVDSLPEMGAYLQALGVAEMIVLVARVQQRLNEAGSLLVGGPTADAPLVSQPRY